VNIRLAACIEHARVKGVANLTTEVSGLMSEYVLRGFRHFHFADENITVCGIIDIKQQAGEPGYSSTCKECALAKREMCRARREEGQRIAKAHAAQVAVNQMNKDFAALFDNFNEEAGPPHFDEVDDAVLSRQLKRRAVLMEQDGEADAAYFLREAARRIDLIYDYKG
jgi:hypothetical protein